MNLSLTTFGYYDRLLQRFALICKIKPKHLNFFKLKICLCLLLSSLEALLVVFVQKSTSSLAPSSVLRNPSTAPQVTTTTFLFKLLGKLSLNTVLNLTIEVKSR